MPDLQELQPTGLQVVQGDVTQRDSLAAATAGAAGVIYTAAGHGNGFLGTAAVDYQVAMLQMDQNLIVKATCVLLTCVTCHLLVGKVVAVSAGLPTSS
jgi:hypothetical protein